MTEYLTPAEVEGACQRHDEMWPVYTATLREYAAIVEAVATDERYCHCPHLSLTATYPVTAVTIPPMVHLPDCVYHRAREVRGYE